MVKNEKMKNIINFVRNSVICDVGFLCSPLSMNRSREVKYWARKNAHRLLENVYILYTDFQV